LRDTDLLIDGLLGLGASRAPDGPIAQAIDAANGSGRPVLAIDLPSGLNVDTGQARGDQAMRADWTLSLLTLKPGLFTALGAGPGRRGVDRRPGRRRRRTGRRPGWAPSAHAAGRARFLRGGTRSTRAASVT
jgi:hypothetical protein